MRKTSTTSELFVSGFVIMPSGSSLVACFMSQKSKITSGNQRHLGVIQLTHPALVPMMLQRCPLQCSWYLGIFLIVSVRVIRSAHCKLAKTTRRYSWASKLRETRNFVDHHSHIIDKWRREIDALRDGSPSAEKDREVDLRDKGFKRSLEYLTRYGQSSQTSGTDMTRAAQIDLAVEAVLSCSEK